MILQYLHGAYRKAWEELSVTECSDTMRGNSFKLEEGRYVRKKFFTVRAVTHWSGLPSEVVDVPSLAASKARLDVALGSLV